MPDPVTDSRPGSYTLHLYMYEIRYTQWFSQWVTALCGRRYLGGSAKPKLHNR